MKNVGIVVNSVGFGGNERSAVNIANALKPFFNVFIIIQEDNGNHYNYDGKIINMDTPCASSKIGKIFNSLKRILKLKKIIKENKIESILLILPVSNPINYLKFKCKKIVSCRDCGDLQRRYDKYQKITEKSDLMVCNSKKMSSIIKSKSPNLSNKVITIYNIVDVNAINILKNKPLDKDIREFMEGHKIIITMGRFVNAKGFNNLIKSFYQLTKINSNVRLIMMGNGNLDKDIINLIDEMKISDKVKILGFQDNPFKYIRHSDAFVLSSFYEGFPNVLVEAMASGCPVIATDCPSGPAEILDTVVEDGFSISEYGILTQYITEEESSWISNDFSSKHMIMANALDTLLKDSSMSSKLKSQAQDRIKDFTEKKIVEQWNSVIGEL